MTRRTLLALGVGATLAAFVARTQSAAADDGADAGERPTPPQWWSAPTTLGKLVLLLEDTVRALHDTRTMLSDAYTGARTWLGDVLEGGRHRIVHRHKKVDIPFYLLPAPLPPGAQKPLTLVVDLDLLFHQPPERIQRAGFEYFLTQASDFCEIVLVSDQRAKGIFEALQGLDPLGLISFRLSGEHFFDEHAKYGDLDTFPVRDLARLRRDLRHVVVLTGTPERYPRHGENVLMVANTTWHLDGDDRALYELVPVLLHLSQQGDVRRTLPRYDGLDVAALTRAHIEIGADVQASVDDG